jgi:hypothetical protein
LIVYAVEVLNEVTISATIPLDYGKHRTKHNVGVELRLRSQQLRYPVWLRNLIVINKRYERRAGGRYSTIPRVRHSRAQLPDINDRQPFGPCDADHDVAR